MIWVIVVHDMESPIGPFDSYAEAEEWRLRAWEENYFEEDEQSSIVPLEIPKKFPKRG